MRTTVVKKRRRRQFVAGAGGSGNGVLLVRSRTGQDLIYTGGAEDGGGMLFALVVLHDKLGMRSSRQDFAWS